VTTKRVNMVYFHVPFEETDDVTFHAPSGFKIETVPDEEKINPGAVSYERSATQAGNSAEVKRHLKVNAIVVPVESYPAFVPMGIVAQAFVPTGGRGIWRA